VQTRKEEQERKETEVGGEMAEETEAKWGEETEMAQTLTVKL